MFNKSLIVLLTTNAEHFEIFEQHLGEKRIKKLPMQVASCC